MGSNRADASSSSPSPDFTQHLIHTINWHQEFKNIDPRTSTTSTQTQNTEKMERMDDGLREEDGVAYEQHVGSHLAQLVGGGEETDLAARRKALPVVAASPPTIASRTPLPSPPPPPGRIWRRGGCCPSLLPLLTPPHVVATKRADREREGGPRERGEDAVEIIIKTERIWIDGAVRFGSARLRGVSFFKEKVRFTPVLLRLTETPPPTELENQSFRTPNY